MLAIGPRWSVAEIIAPRGVAGAAGDAIVTKKDWVSDRVCVAD